MIRSPARPKRIRVVFFGTSPDQLNGKRGQCGVYEGVCTIYTPWYTLSPPRSSSLPLSLQRPRRRHHHFRNRRPWKRNGSREKGNPKTSGHETEMTECSSIGQMPSEFKLWAWKTGAQCLSPSICPHTVLIELYSNTDVSNNWVVKFIISDCNDRSHSTLLCFNYRRPLVRRNAIEICMDKKPCNTWNHNLFI